MSLYQNLKEFFTPSVNQENFWRAPQNYGMSDVPQIYPEPGNDDKLTQSAAEKSYSLRSAVVEKIAMLGSLVEIEVEGSAMDRRRFEFPSQIIPQKSWLKNLIYMMNEFGGAGLVDWRNTLVLLPPREGIEISSDKSFTFTDEFGDTQKTSKNIVMFFSQRNITRINLKMARVAEIEFWSAASKINQNFQNVMTADMDFRRLGETEYQASLQRLRQYAGSSATPIFDMETQIVPSSRSSEKLADMFELVLRMYCHAYFFPTSLMQIDLPSHSDSSFESAYGNFLRMNLMPTLEPVFRGLGEYFKAEIKVDYSKIQKPTDLEQAKVLKELAQTGVLTINEVRARGGYDAISGGDELPSPAGSPPAEKDGDGSDSDSEGG